MKWETMRLSDCCASIADGDHQPPPKSEQGVPFVTIANINSYNEFDFSDTMFVPQEYYDRLDGKRKAQIGDVLYSVVGSFGIPVLIKDNTRFVFQRHIAILRPDTSIILPEFLYYTLLSRDFYAEADAVALGAAQRTISLTSLRNISINIPAIDYQKKIISILSSYDHLIKNNQKQIKLLEEAAQRLYKEWFIDLRFPSHETTPIINGIPEGWKIKRVSDFGEVITGKTPSTSHSDYFGGDIPFVRIPDMHDCIFPVSTESTLTESGANSQKKKYIPIGSIMVSCIATVGLVNISVHTCQTNQQINSIVPAKHHDLYYLYFCMKGIQSLLDGVGSNGATMTNVNKSKFENLNVIYPSNRLIERFYAFCEPIFSDILKLSVMNCKLKETRDRLLPKLMSGEIEV